MKRLRPQKYNSIPLLNLLILFLERGFLVAKILSGYYKCHTACSENESVPPEWESLDRVALMANLHLDQANSVAPTFTTYIGDLWILSKLAGYVTEAKGQAYLLWYQSKAYLLKDVPNDRNFLRQFGHDGLVKNCLFWTDQWKDSTSVSQALTRSQNFENLVRNDLASKYVLGLVSEADYFSCYFHVSLRK